MTGTQAVVRRPPLLVQGLAGGAVGALLAALAFAHDNALLGGVAVLQVVAVLGFLAVSDAPAAGGAFAIGMGAAVAADVIVVVDDGSARYLGGVVGISLVLGLLHQLSRKERSRVTESLADTLVVAMLVAAAACLPAALRSPGGQWPTKAVLVAGAAALLAGRVADAVVNRPALTRGATRAWPGLVLALGAGVAGSVVTAHNHLSSGRAALIGLSAAAAVAAVDLLVDLAGAELTPDPADARRVAALLPAALALPFVMLGPVALAAFRFLDGAS